MIKNKAIKILSIFLLLIVCLTSFINPSASAATKYNYIANGEKNILGFKISNIVQIDECSSIDITMTSTKNIVEFSNYQKVEFNDVEYEAGNHAIEINTKNATFTFNDIAPGTIISPIIIYVDKIENTSCPLVISHKNGDNVIEEVKLTLSATFYSNEPSDIVNNKENTSGSLTQEDVIISRPKEEKPTEKPEVTPPENNDNNDSSNNNENSNVGNENNNENNSPSQRPNENENENGSGNEENNQNQEETTQPETQDPSQSDNEVNLPIIDEDATIDKEQDFNNQEQTSSQPNDSTPSKPNEDNEEKQSILDFINNIDKKILIIAIVGVLVVLIIVVILIIVFSKPKDKKENTEINNTPIIETIEQQDSQSQQSLIENPFSELSDESVNPTIVNEPENEYSPIPVFEETVNTGNTDDMTISDGVDNISQNNEDEIPAIQDTSATQDTNTVELNTPVEEVPMIVPVDEFETILNTTIPKEELEKLKNDFNDNQSIEDSENEYSDIIQ